MALLSRLAPLVLVGISLILLAAAVSGGGVGPLAGGSQQVATPGAAAAGAAGLGSDTPGASSAGAAALQAGLANDPQVQEALAAATQGDGSQQQLETALDDSLADGPLNEAFRTAAAEGALDQSAGGGEIQPATVAAGLENDATRAALAATLAEELTSGTLAGDSETGRPPAATTRAINESLQHGALGATVAEAFTETPPPTRVDSETAAALEKSLEEEPVGDELGAAFASAGSAQARGDAIANSDTEAALRTELTSGQLGETLDTRGDPKAATATAAALTDELQHGELGETLYTAYTERGEFDNTAPAIANTSSRTLSATPLNPTAGGDQPTAGETEGGNAATGATGSGATGDAGQTSDRSGSDTTNVDGTSSDTSADGATAGAEPTGEGGSDTQLGGAATRGGDERTGSDATTGGKPSAGATGDGTTGETAAVSADEPASETTESPPGEPTADTTPSAEGDSETTESDSTTDASTTSEAAGSDTTPTSASPTGDETAETSAPPADMDGGSSRADSGGRDSGLGLGDSGIGSGEYPTDLLVGLGVVGVLVLILLIHRRYGLSRDSFQRFGRWLISRVRYTIQLVRDGLVQAAMGLIQLWNTLLTTLRTGGAGLTELVQAIVTLPATLLAALAAILSALQPTRVTSAVSSPTATDTADKAGTADGAVAGEARRTIRTLWQKFLTVVNPPNLTYKTPGEIGRYAINQGVPSQPVQYIVESFRRVEYTQDGTDEIDMDAVEDAVHSVTAAETGETTATDDTEARDGT